MGGTKPSLRTGGGSWAVLRSSGWMARTRVAVRIGQKRFCLCMINDSAVRIPKTQGFSENNLSLALKVYRIAGLPKQTQIFYEDKKKTLD